MTRSWHPAMTSGGRRGRGRHAVSALHVHLVFVTRYRRGVPGDDTLRYRERVMRKARGDFEAPAGVHRAGRPRAPARELPAQGPRARAREPAQGRAAARPAASTPGQRTGPRRTATSGRRPTPPPPAPAPRRPPSGSTSTSSSTRPDSRAGAHPAPKDEARAPNLVSVPHFPGRHAPEHRGPVGGQVHRLGHHAQWLQEVAVLVAHVTRPEREVQDHVCPCPHEVYQARAHRLGLCVGPQDPFFHRVSRDFATAVRFGARAEGWSKPTSISSNRGGGSVTQWAMRLARVVFVDRDRPAPGVRGLALLVRSSGLPPDRLRGCVAACGS